LLRELPRYLGFPNQVYVERRFAFDNFYRAFNGKTPFFVSTYHFIDKATPVVDKIIFDVDSYFGIRIPYNNVKQLKQFCERKDIPYVINFSGGKGFHFFMMIKDIIPKCPGDKTTLKDKIYSLQVSICDRYNIQAVDHPTFGRLHFMIRYPTSKYVRSRKTNGYYCRYIEPKDFEKGLKHISELAKTKGELPPDIKGDQSLDDIIDMIPNFKMIDRTNGEDTIELIRSEMEPPTIDALVLPCMKEFVTHAHPPHYERVELVAWLKWLGFKDEAIALFIKSRNWTRYKYETTRYQVSTIRGRYPNCKQLRRSYGDMCEENKCPLRRRSKE